MVNSSFIKYIDQTIARRQQSGKESTADKYRAARNSLMRFLVCRHSTSLPLHHITAELIEQYQAYLQAQGLAPNTTSFYMRNLRAIYNRAVDDGLVAQTFPFRHVYTGIAKTIKRAIPLDAIAKIKALELSAMPALDFARDMFMLAFYLRGMSFVDMSFLKKTDLRDNILAYRRRKTGQQLIIKWTAEMQEIIDKYPNPGSNYLLPIIKKENINRRYAYRNAAYRVNRNLKKIALMAGIHTISLTHYVARHSWATAARTKGIPLAVISQGMGHDSERTTQIYLASLDTSLIDNANDIIIKALK